MKNINLDTSKEYILPVLSDLEYKETGKGWSFFNVYSLRELKDIYLVTLKNQHKSNKDIAGIVKDSVVPAYKDWDDVGRRVLENINALKNLNIVDKGNSVTELIKFRSNLNEELKEDDYMIFYKYFFEYIRFVEMSSWFVNPKHNSKTLTGYKFDVKEFLKYTQPIYYFSYESRFTDAIIYELTDSADIYRLNPEMKHMIRFWNVFISWGTELKLLNKFNMRDLDYKLYTKHDVYTPRPIWCVYFVKSVLKFSLEDFIKENFKSNYVYIPELIYKVVLKYQMPVEAIKELIIEQVTNNTQTFNFERTSEIFIRKSNLKQSDVLLFPLFKNSYVSHISLR